MCSCLSSRLIEVFPFPHKQQGKKITYQVLVFLQYARDKVLYALCFIFFSLFLLFWDAIEWIRGVLLGCCFGRSAPEIQARRYASQLIIHSAPAHRAQPSRHPWPDLPPFGRACCASLPRGGICTSLLLSVEILYLEPKITP